MDNNCITVDLSEIYSDHRSRCKLLLDSSRFEKVGDIENFLREGLKIHSTPFYLEGDGIWIPQFEQVNILLAAEIIKLKLVNPKDESFDYDKPSFECEHTKEKKKKKKKERKRKLSLSLDSIERTIDQLQENESCENIPFDPQDRKEVKKNKKDKKRKLNLSLDLDGSKEPVLENVSYESCYKPTFEPEEREDKINKEEENDKEGEKQGECDVSLEKNGLVTDTEASFEVQGKKRRLRIRRRKKKNSMEYDDFHCQLSNAKETAIAFLDSQLTFHSTNDVNVKGKHIHFESDEDSNSSAVDDELSESKPSLNEPIDIHIPAEVDTSTKLLSLEILGDKSIESKISLNGSIDIHIPADVNTSSKLHASEMRDESSESKTTLNGSIDIHIPAEVNKITNCKVDSSPAETVQHEDKPLRYKVPVFYRKPMTENKNVKEIPVGDEKSGDLEAEDVISFKMMYISQESTPTVTDEIVGKVLSIDDKITVELISGTVMIGKAKCRFSEDEELSIYNPPSTVRLNRAEMINLKIISKMEIS